MNTRYSSNCSELMIGPLIGMPLEQQVWIISLGKPSQSDNKDTYTINYVHVPQPRCLAMGRGNWPTMWPIKTVAVTKTYKVNSGDRYA